MLGAAATCSCHPTPSSPHLAAGQPPAIIQHAAREHAHQRGLAAVHVADHGHAHLHGRHALASTAPHQHVSRARRHHAPCGNVH
jgi:hypothetical protein